MISPGLFLAQRNRGFRRGTGAVHLRHTAARGPRMPRALQGCHEAKKIHGFFNHDVYGFMVDILFRDAEKSQRSRHLWVQKGSEPHRQR